MSLKKYVLPNSKMAFVDILQTRTWFLLYDSRKFNIAILFLSAAELIPGWTNRLFSYRHFRAFIYWSLDKIYGFHLDASKNRLWYAHMTLQYRYTTKFYPFFTNVAWCQLFTINTVNHILKPLDFQCQNFSLIGL